MVQCRNSVLLLDIDISIFHRGVVMVCQLYILITKGSVELHVEEVLVEPSVFKHLVHLPLTIFL